MADPLIKFTSAITEGQRVRSKYVGNLLMRRLLWILPSFAGQKINLKIAEIRDNYAMIQKLQHSEDVPLVEFMYLVFTCMPGESEDVPLWTLWWSLCTWTSLDLWWSLCTLYLHTCQVGVTVGDSGLCCCSTCVTDFERYLTPLCADSARALWASFCLRVIDE